ncbi:MAG: hypothetical protein ISS87_01390 [Candidatus Pacebacteria bacterium]|nr:hypothetical protein [Candidatus Paceibacterota bacterium]
MNNQKNNQKTNNQPNNQISDQLKSHLNNPNTNWKNIAIVAIILALVFAGILGYQLISVPKQVAQLPEINVPEQTPEIPEEPEQPQIPADWKAYRGNGYAFYYPEELNMDYVNIYPWPPEVVISLPDTTIPVSLDSLCSGISYSELVTIKDTIYCVTTRSDGAAGTSYSNYEYFTYKDNWLAFLAFEMRLPNCGNFYGLDNKMEQCKKEQSEFDPNVLADQILSTFKFLD